MGGDRWLDLRCDLTQDEDLARAVTRIMRRGVPDLVVNGAGAFAYGPFETTGVDTLDTLYRANLRVPYTVARAFLPGMRRAGRGRHILLGSIADHRALANNAAYPATNPTKPADLAATVYQLLGVDPRTAISDRLKRPQTLCEGEPIRNIMA